MKPNNLKAMISVLALTVLFLFMLSGCTPPKKNGKGSANNNSISYDGSNTDITVNSAPIANAGYDISVVIGSYVRLSGIGSSDPDGDILTFTWSFSSKPEGSTAYLSSSFETYPTFIPDKTGAYVIQLIVNDGVLDSSPDIVTISATTPYYGNTNIAPIANAGPDQGVKTGTVVTLDGSNSFDIDAGELIYVWLLLEKPAGSQAMLSSDSEVSTAFTADMDGSYMVQLIVNDGETDSLAYTVTVVASSPVLMPVPDTGQTGDYTPTFGEDSDYTGLAPSYVVNGDGTVTDAVTGLIWQQEDDGVTRDWAEALNYCGSLNLGGVTGWRVPDNKELVNIVDYGRSKPSIDTSVFLNTQSSGYWSSTEYGLNPGRAWDLLFDNGGSDSRGTDKANAHYVRCVRGAQSVPVFTDNGDGTATDDTTGLMWQQADDSTERKWNDALLYCENLDVAGYADWRLPNVKELMSLIDYRYWPFTINHVYFPSTLKLKGESVPNYWSSTTASPNSNQAWSVHFLVGTFYNTNKSGADFVRCVRSGPVVE